MITGHTLDNGDIATPFTRDDTVTETPNIGDVLHARRDIGVARKGDPGIVYRIDEDGEEITFHVIFWNGFFDFWRASDIDWYLEKSDENIPRLAAYKYSSDERLSIDYHMGLFDQAWPHHERPTTPQDSLTS